MDLDRLVSSRWRPRLNRRQCCRDKDNMQYALAENTRKDIVVLKCRKCGALHHNVAQEAGSYVKKLGR